jgi:hypothetical protein
MRMRPILSVFAASILATALLYGDARAHAGPPADDDLPSSLCRVIQKARFDLRDFAKGYGKPVGSLLDLTQQERSGGMVCKFSIELSGPAPFSAIRYRVFQSEGAARDGLRSMTTAVPGLRVIDRFSRRLFEKTAPCFAYTTGATPLTFVTCAQPSEMFPLIIGSGVSSETTAGQAYNERTVSAALALLESGHLHLISAAVGGLADELLGSKK